MRFVCLGLCRCYHSDRCRAQVTGLIITIALLIVLLPLSFFAGVLHERVKWHELVTVMGIGRDDV
jgi:NhaP-type Na+/H+ and K+/H+ antiporter